MAMEEVVKQISEALSKEGNSRVVFGEPMKLDSKTVIPVAAVKAGGGGGGVLPRTEENGAVKTLFSGGGGLGLDVQPVGFIHEREGEVIFTPIHVDAKSKPLLVEAARGLGKLVDSLTHTASALVARRGRAKATLAHPSSPPAEA